MNTDGRPTLGSMYRPNVMNNSLIGSSIDSPGPSPASSCNSTTPKLRLKSESKDTPPPQLNCEECRDRKIKCDKRQPCSACVAAKIKCEPIFRRRLARGRHAPAGGSAGAGTVTKTTAYSRHNDIKQRMRRLGELVSRASPVPILPAPEKTTEKTADFNTDATAYEEPQYRPHAMQHPDHFWTNLRWEVEGLRNVIESTPEDAEDDTAQTHAEVSNKYDRPWDMISLLGFSSLGMSKVDPTHILHDRNLAAALCTIYLYQVDPILKILHRPTLEQHLMEGKPYLGYPEDGHLSVTALDTAVLYLAVNSMQDDQCLKLLGLDRVELLADTRQACEAALEKAGLLTTRDMTVLQAFVIYLAGRQVEEPSRAVWTLFAVAVRVAKGLGINLPQKNGSFFLRQIRQHLWLTICVMDVQLAFNMTSQPLIPANEACLSPDDMPRHINDADYGPSTFNPPPDRSGLTDATYALIKYRIQAFGRKMQFVPSPTTSFVVGLNGDNNAGESETIRQNAEDLCDEFTIEIMARTFGIDPSQSPFAWLVFHSAQCFTAGARAAIHMYKPDTTKQGRPEFLRATAQGLEKTVLIHTDERGTAFRWYVTVRWNILALALAECYACGNAINPDAKLLREVWPTMEAAYAHHASIIGKHRGGRLSGPLSKLMDKARQAVESIIGTENVRHTVEAGASTTFMAAGSPDLSGDIQVENTDNPLDSASWESCWDEFMSASKLDDDMSMFDTQF